MRRCLAAGPISRLRHCRSKDLVIQTAIQVWYKRKSACVTSVLSQYGSFPVSSDWFTSSVRTLRFGVPQESVLGRSYLLYTTPLGDIIRWHIWYGIPSICWWYSTVHLTFSCDDSVDLTTIQFPGLRAALSISLTGWLLKNWS